MAINTYIDKKTGETLYKVSISLRSKTDTRVRVQKAKFAIRTKPQAERDEQTLLRECLLSLQSKENEGASWGALVDAWEKYLIKYEANKVNAITRSDYVASIRKHTKDWLNREAASITKVDAREVFLKADEMRLRPTHQVRIKHQLNRVFTFGIEHGLVNGMTTSPVHGIRIDTKTEKKPEILSIQEIKKLLQSAKAMHSPWYVIWAMALFTGMRSGELYALTWKDVDFEASHISVTKSYNCRLKAIKSTKAGYWRTVPISTELMTLLKEIKLEGGNRDHVLHRPNAWTKGLQAKELRQFCIGIGLPSIKFHTLRACFATQLIRAAVPPIQIQKICGWRDLETMQRYIRLAGIEVTGATEALKLLPEEEFMGKVVDLFTHSN